MHAGYPHLMSRRSLQPFRRSRHLLAWALCAWLALVSMAWAQTDCCTGMHMPDSTGMHDAAHAHGQGPMATADCACVHAPATLPPTVALGMISRLPAHPLAVQGHRSAPQRAQSPPLRPPANDFA